MRNTVVSEKQLIDRLSAYWKRLKKDNVLPKIQKLNSAAIEDVWPHCFLLRVEGGIKHPMFLYEYVGAEIKQAYGEDPSGTHVVLHVKNAVGAAVLNKLDLCLVDNMIHEEYGTFINNKNKTVKFHSYALPFCSNLKNNVTHVLVGLSWRAF